MSWEVQIQKIADWVSETGNSSRLNSNGLHQSSWGLQLAYLVTNNSISCLIDVLLTSNRPWTCAGVHFTFWLIFTVFCIFLMFY